MPKDGKNNPFDGSGGKGSGAGISYEQSSQSRPQPSGAREVNMVPPGGPLPFTTPQAGRKTGDIAPKKSFRIGGS